MVQDAAILTMADQQASTYVIYRTAPFSMTLKWPWTISSRSRHYMTLNISETVRN